LRGVIRGCFANSRVCTRLRAPFPRIHSHIRGKSLDNRVGRSAHADLPLRAYWTVENLENDIEMQVGNMSKYLEESVLNSAG